MFNIHLNSGRLCCFWTSDQPYASEFGIRQGTTPNYEEYDDGKNSRNKIKCKGFHGLLYY